jgi:prophage tail gpP-like protein
MNICNVPISIGELYDKFSILQIKKEKIVENEKKRFINKEIEYLQPYIDKFNLDFTIQEKIKHINETLWEIEDKIRIKEKYQLFDDEFILLARMVYKTNDERHKIKCLINSIFDSEIKEMKSYV